MSDNKITSVIKTLERTIGILENCNDLGAVPDVTRKRIIEMLNTAMMDVYFLDAPSEGVSKNVAPASPPPPPPPQISVVAPRKEEKTEVLAKPNPEIRKPEPVAEERKEPEKNVSNPDGFYISEDEISPFERRGGKKSDNLPVVPSTEKITDDNVSSNTVDEDFIFRQPKTMIFEEPVAERNGGGENDKVKNELAALKNQLDEERKRLERELRSWQDEKRKQEDEIIATKKLLESLQQRQESRQNWENEPLIREAPQPTVQTRHQSTERYSETQPSPQTQTRHTTERYSETQPSPQTQTRHTTERYSETQPSPQTRHQSAPERHPADTPSPQTRHSTGDWFSETQQTTLGDSFLGSRKVLHENYENSDPLANQISTRVSSLQKAIGINDRFRFVKELFGGDSDLYCETVSKLDSIGSLGAAISYIESNFSWDKNSDSVKQLISLVRRRYM